jgi:hypothetical protein
MKHLIIAASLTFIAVPAFAGSVHDIPAPKAKTVVDSSQYAGERFDPNSARDVRNANLNRASQQRSANERRAWANLPHYY